MQLPPTPDQAPAANSLAPQNLGLIADPSGNILGDGRYTIGELLGAGGMAEVRRGRDGLLDREIAVKLFRGQSEGRLSERERTEAQLLAGLDHPGLVKVHDVGHSSYFGWVVMDLIEGPDLHRVLYSGALALERVWTIGHDVARTLAYVHAKGITHRDVKPSNILTRDAEPHSGRFGHVLTDFGIARRTDGARLTATGETIGTAAYFSPEQARGQEITAATDIYALGLVLLECLTGEAAFPGRGLETALARLHHSPEIPPSVNPAWRRLITRMTASDPTDRPTSSEVVGLLVAERDGLLSEGRPAAEVFRPAAADRTRRNYVLGLADDDDPRPAGLPAAGPVKGKIRRSSPAPAKQRAHAGGGRRGWVAGAVVVGLLIIAAVLILFNVLAPAPQPEPLPPVPGAPGERLSELYESVQP